MFGIEYGFVYGWKQKAITPDISFVERLRIESTCNFLEMFLRRNKSFVCTPKYGELAPSVIAAGIIVGVQNRAIYFLWVNDSVSIPVNLYVIDSVFGKVNVRASGKLTNEKHIETDYDLGLLRCSVLKCAVDTYSAWRDLGDEIIYRK